MKRTLLTVLLLLPIILGTLVVPKVAAAKGGCMPAFASCCLGPRIGLEMNEGKPIETIEWLQFVLIGSPLCWYDAYQSSGCGGCLVAAFIGHRAGRELKERKLRTKEILIPVLEYTLGLGIIPQLLIAFEALDGTTMTEIEQKENLKKK